LNVFEALVDELRVPAVQTDAILRGCTRFEADCAAHDKRDGFRLCFTDTLGRLAAPLLAVLIFQAGANGDGGVGVDGAAALLDVLDFSFLIDDDRGALRPFVFFALHVVRLHDAVRDEDLFVHVAEERESYLDFFGEGGVGGGTVDADSEDNRITCFELGQISLIGLEFFRSTTCECQDVEGKDDVFLSAIIA